MKKIILYICSLLAFAIIFFFTKKIFNQEQSSALADRVLKNDSMVYGEVEVLNGCGEAGVANLFTNFLRKNNFDVIEIKNAEHFNYEYTTLIINDSKDNISAHKLEKLLTINKNNIIKKKNLVWDYIIIIGKDYKELKSFESIQKFYSIF
tara:strand:+ start:685 stop:1134 length:450 start_codon:yes stop_codon:yes gene_type:complete